VWLNRLRNQTVWWITGVCVSITFISKFMTFLYMPVWACYIVLTLTADTTWCIPRCIGGLCGAIGADCYDVTYTPSHSVVEKVLSPVCHCDRCLAYSITFSESLCGSYWDVKPCKEHQLYILQLLCILYYYCMFFVHICIVTLMSLEFSVKSDPFQVFCAGFIFGDLKLLFALYK